MLQVDRRSLNKAINHKYKIFKNVRADFIQFLQILIKKAVRGVLEVPVMSLFSIEPLKV